MNARDEVVVISQIVDLLVECGGSKDKAEWFVNRASMLEVPGQDVGTRAEILADVRRHIPGMNGLIDQYLRPPSSSKYDEESANIRLAELADELYELTRPVKLSPTESNPPQHPSPRARRWR